MNNLTPPQIIALETFLSFYPDNVSFHEILDNLADNNIDSFSTVSEAYETISHEYLSNEIEHLANLISQLVREK